MVGGENSRKRRSNAFYAPGLKGRATGVEISTKKRDQDGLADLNDFYNDSDSDDAYDQFGDDDDGEEEEEKEEEGESEPEDMPAPPRTKIAKKGTAKKSAVKKSAVKTPKASAKKSTAKRATRPTPKASSAKAKKKTVAATPEQPTPIKRLSFHQKDGNETPEFASMDLPGSQDDDDEVPDSPEVEDEPADNSPELETGRASARRPAKPSTVKKGKKTPKSAKGAKGAKSAKSAKKAAKAQAEEEEEEEEEVLEPSPPPKKGGKKKVAKPKQKAETKAQPKKKKMKKKRVPEEPATPKVVELEFVPLDESMVEMPSDLAASRRSSRNRVTPCAFWKNERVVYEEADTLGVSGRPSHTFVAKGKIKPKTPAAPVNRKRRKTTSKANLPAKKKKKLARVEEEESSEDEGNDDAAAVLPKNGVFEVMDWQVPEGEEETIVTIAMAKTQAMMQWANVKNNPNLALSKVFSSRDAPWASGMLKVAEHSEKPRQSTKNNFLFFYLISGKVTVKIHMRDGSSDIPLSKGGMFFVPPGNVYSLLNTGAKSASLVFVQVKIALPGMNYSQA